jgi:uncharacterized OB-fold protein
MAGSSNRLLPRPTPETEVWWEGCRRHRLLLQHCPACGTHQFYPRALCADCLGANLDWVEAAGRATVETFTICRVPVTDAYAARVPYVVAIVRLEEGPAMMTNIVGCEPESVAIGMPVEVVFEDCGNEIALPQFRPRPGAAPR